MKKVLTVILSLCLAISLCGCSSSNTPISINVENLSDLNGTTAGRKALIEIGGLSMVRLHNTDCLLVERIYGHRIFRYYSNPILCAQRTAV